MLRLQTHTVSVPATVRERELEAGRVVLRAVAGGDAFLLRRAKSVLEKLDGSVIRRPLRHALEAATSPEPGSPAAAGVLAYGSLLERHGEYEAAEEAYRVALGLAGDPCMALHAARAARKANRREAALELYRRAADGAQSNTRMQLMVAIGEALVSMEPERELGAVLRRARAAGDRIAVAIAREERACIRARAARTTAALRDLMSAAVRYTETQDRIRVLHRLGDLLTARGELMAAREALLAAVDLAAGTTQRAHTVQRLRTVARALGDDLGVRRTRGQGSASLVMLAPVARRAARALSPTLPRVQRLRDTLTLADRRTAARDRQR